MTGFKVVIKATAHGYNKERLAQAIKVSVEHNQPNIKIEHIKCKGTTKLNGVDEIGVLNDTISRRNAKIYSLEKVIYNHDDKVERLEARVEELLAHIRNDDGDDGDGFCNHNDWRSVGSDPVSGDKLKRCNICERVGVR